MKYMRIPLDYVIYTDATNAQKPCSDYWSKYESNSICSMMLKREKPHQNDTWDHDNIVWKKNNAVTSSDIGEHSVLTIVNCSKGDYNLLSWSPVNLSLTPETAERTEKETCQSLNCSTLLYLRSYIHNKYLHTIRCLIGETRKYHDTNTSKGFSWNLQLHKHIEKGLYFNSMLTPYTTLCSLKDGRSWGSRNTQDWKYNTKMLPDIAGVSIPSPIVIHVPSKTKINRPLQHFGFFSKNDFKTELCHVSADPSTAYADSFSSVSCWLGRMLSFAWRHSNEYNAKVPPELRQSWKFHQVGSEMDKHTLSFLQIPSGRPWINEHTAHLTFPFIDGSV